MNATAQLASAAARFLNPVIKATWTTSHGSHAAKPLSRSRPMVTTARTPRDRGHGAAPSFVLLALTRGPECRHRVAPQVPAWTFVGNTEAALVGSVCGWRLSVRRTQADVL